MDARRAMSFFALSNALILISYVLLKLHVLTRLIESFAMVYELWRCIEVKVSIPLGAHA